MAVYAAQIDRLDQGVGRILAALRSRDMDGNTLIMFLSDNGGCAEFLAEDGSMPQPARYGGILPDGSAVQVGNIPGMRPGGPQTFMSYDLPWANASNTPFRRFKRWTHEGGISMPFIHELARQDHRARNRTLSRSSHRHNAHLPGRRRRRTPE